MQRRMLEMELPGTRAKVDMRLAGVSVDDAQDRVR